MDIRFGLNLCNYGNLIKIMFDYSPNKNFLNGLHNKLILYEDPNFEHYTNRLNGGI